MNRYDAAKRLARFSTALLAVITLAGCAVGQSLDMEYEADAQSNVGAGIAVGATVNDVRPYVTNGDKDPEYIGQYRAGFGIPYDVSTDGDEPLADVVLRDISKELASLGFTTSPNTASARTLAVNIRDWNFDSYQNGNFKYDVELTVRAAGGEVLATSTVSDEVYVKGTFWSGGKGGFENAMPGMYRDLIRALVRENSEVLSALSRR